AAAGLLLAVAGWRRTRRIREATLAAERLAERMASRVEELGRERDERERILAHMADGVALLDADGRVVHANRAIAGLLGLDQLPDPGRRLLDGARQPGIAALIERARASDGPLTEEIAFYSPWERVVEATALRLGSGDDSSLLLVLHDLSRMKQLEVVRQEF